MRKQTGLPKVTKLEDGVLLLGTGFSDVSQRWPSERARQRDRDGRTDKKRRDKERERQRERWEGHGGDAVHWGVRETRLTHLIIKYF